MKLSSKWWYNYIKGSENMNKKQFMILIICVLLIALAVVSFVYIRQTNLLIEKERRIRYLEDQLRETEREKNELEEAKRKDEKDDEESKKYSDLYVAMADKLGISLKSDRKKAMVVPLGSAYDEETLKEVLSKLKLWSSEYYDVNDINKLLVLAKDEEANNTYLMAQEFYIVIPKYRAAKVSLKELELLDTGKLSPVKNDFLDGKSFTSPVLICQNISDIAPNGEISITGEDRELKFSPFVSLKDGELILPDEVYNAYGALDMKKYDKNNYDEDLFNEISSYFYSYD